MTAPGPTALAVALLGFVGIAACGALDVPDGDEPSACRDHLALLVMGDGFDADDGAQVRGVTDSPAADGIACRSTASSEIEAGRFTLWFGYRTDEPVYRRVQAFIDGDGDGLCSTSDPTWAAWLFVGRGAGPYSPHPVWSVPSDFSLEPSAAICGAFADER